MARLPTRRTLCAALAVASAPGAAWAQAQETLPEITIIGVSPLLGSGIDRDKVPSRVVSLTGDDIARGGSHDLAGTLDRLVPSVTISDVQASPFQPDLEFRGFDASPVLGTPQGIAVYQNGVRINEAFGDTVNWDLVPDFAIDRVNLLSANPVFGLNALGGALALEMKNGFSFTGAEGELGGGSFGRIEGTGEYGVRVGNFAAYIGARGLSEAGWRDGSPASLHQLYADLGAEQGASKLHLSIAGASNLINAIGPTPVELLQQRYSAAYTSPQFTRNDLALVTLAGSTPLASDLQLDGNVYYRRFHQTIGNGNTTDAQPCGPPVGPGTLCFNDPATVLFDANGDAVPNVLGNGTQGEIDRTATTAQGLGGSLQIMATERVRDHANHFVAGMSLDHGSVDFSAASELGIIEPNLLVSGTGYIIDQPAGDLAPVRLSSTNDYYGAYVTDSFDITSALTMTVSGRYNLALVRLDDLAGTSLSGDHHYGRFNPATGFTYKFATWLTGYIGYSETNRAPTAAELACADPARPCIVDNFLVSDPSLKQVVARTSEMGLRGATELAAPAGHLAWHAGLFRTDTDHDILDVPSALSGFGFFQNAGATRRQGVEAGAKFATDKWLLRADYAFLDATFRNALTLSSPFNPAADLNGNIFVVPGDHLPSLPAHRMKLGVAYRPAPDWTVGANLAVASGQYLRGDEANENAKLPGYHTVGLDASYRINDRISVQGVINNLLGAKYDTFGTFFDTTQIPALGLSDPRTLSPGAPRSIMVFVRAAL
jgi:iron complex outermembrane recepter protein